MSKNFELLRRSHSSNRELQSTSIPVQRTLGNIRPRTQSEWLHAVYVIWRYRRLSLAFAGLVMLVVFALTCLMKPVYEPHAILEVSPPGAEAFTIQSGSLVSGDSEYIETQAKNLESDLLAIRVVRELHLDRLPEFSSGKLHALISRVSEKIRPRSAEDLSGITQRLDEIPELTKAEADAVSAFHDKLTVKRDITSRLINVSFATSDPKLSAVVLNTLVKDFIEETFESRHNAVEQSSTWLTKQLEDVRKQMESSNQALAQFQKNTGIVDVDTNKSTVSEQIAEQGRQLEQAQTQAMLLQAYLDRVHRGDLELLPQTGSDPVVQQLISKLAQARADLAQATPIYGYKHPTVVRLRNEVAEYEKELNRQRAAILAQLKTSYAAAQAQKTMLKSQLDDSSRRMSELAEYNNLKREAQANADLFNSLFTKVKEAGIAAEAKSSNVQLASPPRVLQNPTRPSWPLNLGFGFALSLVGGVLLPFVVDKFDNHIYDTDDMQEKLGTSNVCIIPVAESSPVKGFLPPAFAPRNGSEGTTSKFILESPDSAAAEAVRGLYTSILLGNPRRAPEVLLVASPLPGEGKTTIATNLAIGLSAHAPTCIVDADLRNPRVAKAFRMPAGPGLPGILAGETGLDDALLEVQNIPGLRLISGGTSRGDVLKLILSEAMAAAVHRLREMHTFVVIDSPPILLYSDARTLSSLADKVILVSRFGSTTFEAVGHSLELLRSSHAAPITQVVLNAAETRLSPYTYLYGYPRNA